MASNRRKESAGIVIRHGGRILLCHSTDKAPTASHTPPKGAIEPGESPIQAAIRECWEEVGIKVDQSDLDPSPTVVKHRGPKGVKVFHLFTLRISDLSEVGLESHTVPASRLQQGEIDWAGFMDAEEAARWIDPRFKVLYESNI